METTSPHALTESWIRASFRDLDKKASTPYHPVLSGKQKLVVPGEINEYTLYCRKSPTYLRRDTAFKLEISSMNSGKDQDAHTSSYVLSISRPTVT